MLHREYIKFSDHIIENMTERNRARVYQLELMSHIIYAACGCPAHTLQSEPTSCCGILPRTGRLRDYAEALSEHCYCTILKLQ